jgi:uncharacterized protein YicC (UPF0701 family)
MAKKGPKSMSAEHKAALAAGRAEGRAVKDYLQALENSRPKRGRRRTPDSIQKRLDTIEESIPTANPMTRLSLIQERNDLTLELDNMADETDISELEKAFTNVAKAYSERKGIGYAAWREIGVPAAVLKDAGITRSA